jgi:hypothetical protein
MGGIGRVDGMAKYCYENHGLRVESEFAIPEWDSFEASEQNSPSDVRIVIDSECDGGIRPAGEGEYQIRAKDAGWLIVRRGVEIGVLTGSQGVTRRLRLFLIGSAWGTLLYQRALFPLHGSAVRTEKGAVLFCGRRGQGKSTLATYLRERGYEPISDDLCRVTIPEDGSPLVYPSAPVFKLWGDSAHELGLNRDELLPDHSRSDKFHYVRPNGTVPPPLPVWAVYLVTWGDVGFERLRGFSALNRFFAAATWRGELLVSTGDPAGHIRNCAELLRRIPLWEFRRPRDFAAIAATTDALMAHLAEK